MTNKSRSRGFSLVGVLIAVLVVVLLVAGGWYVWQKNKKDDDKQSNNANAQTDGNKKDKQDEAEGAADPSEDGKYMVITDWGVRFELPENMRGDVTYGIQSTSNGRQLAWFEVGSIADLPSSACKLTDVTEVGSSGKRGGVGTFLIKSSSKIPESETPYYYGPATNMEINGSWFTGGRERYSESCVNDEGKRQLVSDTRGALTYALEHLEKIPSAN